MELQWASYFGTSDLLSDFVGDKSRHVMVILPLQPVSVTTAHLPFQVGFLA